MSKYRVQGPDGDVHVFEGPDNATQEQVLAAAEQQFGGGGGQPRQSQKPLSGLGGYSTGLQNSIVQGLTLGAADEIVGGMLGATYYGIGKAKEAFGSGPGPTLGESYNRGLNEARDPQRQFRDQYPVSSIAGETLGGVFSPLGALGAKALSSVAGPAKSLLGAATRGAGIGGTMGGVGGFLSGEGDQDRLDSAGRGAQWGASFGAAVPFIGATVNAMRPASNAPAEKARDMVIKALQQDGLTAEQAAARWQSLLDQGLKPEAAFEMGGENLKNLAKGAALSPGDFQNRSNQFLDARMKGQQGRIADDIKANLTPNDDFYGSMDALTETRKTAAAPLYKEAFQNNKVVASPALDRILATNVGKEALSGAADRMNTRMSLMATPDKELTEIARDLAARGEMAVPQKGVAAGLKLESLDLVKQEMDGMVKALERKVASGNAKQGELNDLRALRGALVKELDNLDVTAKAGPNSTKPEGGAYARARAAYAGPSQSMDALEVGRSILKEDAEMGAKAVAKLSDGDKEFARAGLARALMDKIKSAPDTGDAVKKIFGNNLIRERMEALFPSKEAFGSFANSMQREAEMYSNAQQVMPTRGSQTAGRLAAQEGMLNDKNMRVAEAAGNVAASPANPFAWLRMARAALGGQNKGLDPKVSSALADRLLATGPEGLEMFRALPSAMPPMFPPPNYGLLSDFAAPAAQVPRGLLQY